MSLQVLQGQWEESTLILHTRAGRTTGFDPYMILNQNTVNPCHHRTFGSRLVFDREQTDASPVLG